MNIENLKSEIFNLDQASFENLSLKVFHYQYSNNPIYQQFVDNLNINPNSIQELNQIPFLPIEIFKYQKIYSGTNCPEFYFESSGTSGQTCSKHYYYSTDFYLKIAEKIFNDFYGELKDYHFIGLLPSYLERQNASLVCMVNDFIKKSESDYSGFYLNNFEELNSKIKKLIHTNKKIFIIGVSFGILDWLEYKKLDSEIINAFENDQIILMETGGMKGRRKEMSREELHKIFQSHTHAKNIHSEYGMTELFSQSYSKRDGVFQTGFSKKIILRELNDPFTMVKEYNKTGGINIIDLANVESLSFIATQDAGKLLSNKEFEIMGRIQNSDLRGCNLMVN